MDNDDIKLYKKNKIKNLVFILNKDNYNNYYDVNPNELIIIYSSGEYLEIFKQTILNGKEKNNVSKIITSDLVIVKYIKYITNIFKNIYPNCKTIQINSFENDFNNISSIIDNIQIIQNVEFILNDYIYNNNSLNKYINFFTNSFLTTNLLNIKYIKIINKIETVPDCSIDKINIYNIVDFNLIKKNNLLRLNIIKKYNINQKFINNIYFEYNDIKKNKFTTNIINILVFNY